MSCGVRAGPALIVYGRRHYHHRDVGFASKQFEWLGQAAHAHVSATYALQWQQHGQQAGSQCNGTAHGTRCLPSPVTDRSLVAESTLRASASDSPPAGPMVPTEFDHTWLKLMRFVVAKLVEGYELEELENPHPMGKSPATASNA